MSLPLSAVSFLIGVTSLLLFPRLPAQAWLLLLPFAVLGAWRLRVRWIRLLLVLLCGLLWAMLSAWQYQARVLPESLAGQPVWVQGVVSDIPRTDQGIQRFLLEVEHIEFDHPGPLPGKLRLSWYDATESVRAGERWRLKVKLKPPHGFLNPGGFDYEKWLFEQGIHATGYVRRNDANRRLAAAPRWSVQAWRQTIVERLQTRKGDFTGLWAALAVGHKSLIQDHQWDLLITTGTNHLMAISGLHIGLVAGLVFWLARRLLPLLRLPTMAADPPAAALALLAALVYAWLAGFAIPTQRALVMLLLVLGAVMLRKPVRPGHSLALALWLVLLMDPASVLSAGFWFSFMAVAAIAYSLAGRLGRPRWWLHWGRLQLVIALMLLPLSLFLFQQGSLVAPLANLVLVPWVSLLVVPLVLLAVPALFLWPPLGHGLLDLAQGAMALVWPLLEFLGTLPLASWQQAWPSPGLLLLALCGLLLLLAPRGVPQRWPGVLMLLPGLMAPVPRPADGAFSMTLLDVGQGLSVLVQTRHHRLLFDSGARFRSGFDLGERVVVPFLRSQRLDRLDTLVISHGDNDHIGGAPAVLEAVRVDRLLGRDIEPLDHDHRQLCRAGQHWRWDGVDFHLLHPDRSYRKSNNDGCVLRVSNAHHALLIPADIEAAVENRLVHGDAVLAADVLVVGHHGSRTSSTAGWIDAVAPDYALVSAGYRSRFGHPAPEVVARFRARQVRLMNTADSGAIRIEFPADGAVLRPRAYRRDRGRYWNHTPLR